MKVFLLLMCASVFLISVSSKAYSQMDQDEKNLPIFTTQCNVVVFAGSDKRLNLTENPPTCVEVVQLIRCGQIGSGELAGATVTCKKTGKPAEVSQVIVRFYNSNISGSEAAVKLNTLQVADE